MLEFQEGFFDQEVRDGFYLVHRIINNWPNWRLILHQLLQLHPD